MNFPKRIAILLAKIALERIMSPERADELVLEVRNGLDEINRWLRGGDAEPQISVGEAINDVVVENPESVRPSNQQHEDAIDFVEKLAGRIQSQNSRLTTDTLLKLVEAELPGRRNTYVLWMDDPRIIPAGEPGRYVHFSWVTASNGRIGYKIRDFQAGRMSHPDGTRPNRDWIGNTIPLSAGEVWNLAKERIPTVQATGLGRDLGGVDENRDGWKGALINYRKRQPPDMRT